MYTLLHQCLENGRRMLIYIIIVIIVHLYTYCARVNIILYYYILLL